MARSQASILNRKRLELKLKALPHNGADKVRKAIAKGARELADAARALAPSASGDLKTSIRAEIAPDGLSANVGSDLLYARFVEFGTKGGGKNRPDHPGTTARPFLFPAYRILKKRIVGRIRRAVKAAAKEAAKDNAGAAP